MRLLILFSAILISTVTARGESDVLKKAIWQAMKEAKNSDTYIEDRRYREFEDGYTIPLLFCRNGDRECRQYQAGLIVDVDFSYRGDYFAQRNFSKCLATGCGLMQPQPILSCAWRIVTLASGSPHVNGSDMEEFRRCFAQLGEIQEATAKRQAIGLFRTVYGEELPYEWR